MEYFDILNRHGIPTGQTAIKGTPLEEGQYYLGVHVYIYNPGQEFLLQQRAYNKEFLPGGWDIHMGHVIAGETPLDAVSREVKEEIGFACEDYEPRHIGRIIWEQYHHMIDIYAIEAEFDIHDLTMQEEEVIALKKVGKEDMLALVTGMNYRSNDYRQIVSDYIYSL